ncbi:hypothetical protein [Burkholderia multivorans]|uniref:hypothetical protein n=1 Tax=Burkholderia multivorans TaxID=87883 RepID=UPI0011B28A91|nr:hypothetical protein [Burkholderia multivorans]
MVVFEDPLTAFAAPLDAPAPDEASIHCFASPDDIQANAAAIFQLLNRERLVDTLRLTMPEHEGIAKIPANYVTHYWRGVVVATRPSGSSYRTYPTRTVYPAIIVSSGGRIFGIARFTLPLEEPMDQGAMSTFLAQLQSRGEQFEHDLLGVSGFPCSRQVE